MKKILLIHTGGTIGSAYNKEKNCRVLNAEISDMTLLKEYAKISGLTVKQVKDLFEDSNLAEGERTFSENMTYQKLNIILNNIKTANMEKYCGIIILHGTDTLAYTSALFSFIFSDMQIPIMMVSGNRPPDDEHTNANKNFKTAVDLILQGIAPNVYVPYKNSDCSMWLHLGSAVKQSANYSEDFYTASAEKSFCITDNQFNKADMFKKCAEFSQKRNGTDFECNLDEGVLLIMPYTGMDYAHYSLENVKAVVHGSYHSGTVCVERNNEGDEFHTQSLLWFSKKCDKLSIPVFVAPSKLDSDQYSSVSDLVKNGSVKILNMTTEAAYTKLLLGVSMGYKDEKLIEYMNRSICSEFMN